MKIIIIVITIVLLSIKLSYSNVISNCKNCSIDRIKLETKNVNTLIQLFYPRDVITSLNQIPNEEIKKFCKFKGSLNELKSIEVPKVVSGLNSRMKGSKNLIGVDETVKFVRIFNNLAANAFFSNNNKLKNELIDILFDISKRELLTGNKMCVKDGKIICKMDWNDKEGLDKTGIRDSFFVYNRVLILSYVYYSYLYDVTEIDDRHPKIEKWFNYFIKESKKPKFALGQHGGWSIPKIAYELITKGNIDGNCFGSNCKRILKKIFLNIESKIADDGSIFPNSFRGDRALYYHNDAINEAVILMEIGRSYGVIPKKSLVNKIEKSIFLFLKGYEDHSFMDKWANKGIRGRVRPGVQDFGAGEKDFNNNPNNSWYYIFGYRYPGSNVSKILRNKYKIYVPIYSNSDSRWGISYKCPYTLITKK